MAAPVVERGGWEWVWDKLTGDDLVGPDADLSCNRACGCCGELVELGERAWFSEDGDMLCDTCLQEPDLDAPGAEEAAACW